MLKHIIIDGVVVRGASREKDLSIKYIIGGDLQYIRLKGINPPLEQLIFKDGGRPPTMKERKLNQDKPFI